MSETYMHVPLLREVITSTCSTNKFYPYLMYPYTHPLFHHCNPYFADMVSIISVNTGSKIF